MARSNCAFLDNGDSFPALEFNTVDGSIISLPGDFDKRWNILLFYRGSW
jgi:peroxiredoxin